MAIAILPVLKVGGMQLFRMESSDQSAEKAMPRAAQIASTIGVIYLFLTMVWAGGFSRSWKLGGVPVPEMGRRGSVRALDGWK